MREKLALVFLIVLRIAIGWHFFFEGFEKTRSVYRGETTTSRPWSSENYFREGQGPLADVVRSQIGDTDEMLLAKLNVRPVPPNEDPSKYPPHKRMPPALDKEWNENLESFARAHGLEKQDRDIAAAKLTQQKDKLVTEFTTTKKDFRRTYPTGTFEIKLTVVDRAAEYRQKLQEYRAAQSERLFAMGKDVERSRRPAMRAEVTALRAELSKEVDDRTAEMKKALDDSITNVAKKNPAIRIPESETSPSLIKIIDWTTRWGLMAIGGCLMLGLFSRSAAFGGALFLVMTILTTPSLPWLPAPPMTEGNYVFVSKNVIELIALLLLACTPSGKWFGLDALVSSVFRRKADS